MFILLCALLHNNTLINLSVCSVQSWRRAETPKWVLAYFSQTKSSRRRNGEIKTERQRVSRDLAVRRVVLPGCHANATRKIRVIARVGLHHVNVARTMSRAWSSLQGMLLLDPSVAGALDIHVVYSQPPVIDGMAHLSCQSNHN
jgi:hypothetical protein